MAQGFVLTEGAPEPLGVSLTPDGINVAVWSQHAEAIELCLFDEAGEIEIARLTLPARTGPVFHGHVAGVREGARYGLRASGPFDPAKGHRFNADKLLVDPYALALDRPFALHPTMFALDPADPSFEADSASVTPKGVVVAPAPATVAPPRVPWGETVVYELHVRGFTRLDPDVPEALRGTFAGLAHPAAVARLTRLGVTTVELMPCAAWVDERHLPALGLTNYWGYNPIALMTPDPRLAPGGWAEVRDAIAALAQAGIETIVDVVLNHTGESDELGPTLSLRGLDNASYYRLAADLAYYENDAGTGNVLALDRPAPLRLAMDALRAWRRFGGVAGFRFDLATVLGRRQDGFDPAAPLLQAIDQDPELRGLKLIAEPWDIGTGGYRLGEFPTAWAEWNDRFREDLRGFWRGDAVSLGELAQRLAGSETLFAARRPSRSLNYVVAHDGFTLADLVAYERKHNDPNGEGDRDGTTENHSWNNGVEGPTSDPAIRAARLADQRALLANLLTARGAPMLAMGSERGHSQGGNNNAYVQDNATSWIDWSKSDAGLTDFTARLIAARKAHPALRADRFLTGEAVAGSAYPDVAWRKADGGEPAPADWDDPRGETLVMALAEPDGAGLDRVVVVTHRGHGPVDVALPDPRDGFAWRVLADSADPGRGGNVDDAGLAVAPRSVVLLAETASRKRRPTGADPEVVSRLARVAGIAAEWHSVDGERHGVSPETERALLAAMRLPASTTQAALESLYRLTQSRERRALPTALVRPAGAPIVVDLPQTAARPWVTVELEDGQPLRVRALRTDGTARGRHIVMPPLPPGHYVLRRDDASDTPCHLTVTPGAAFAPAALADGKRGFGLTAQIYALRRDGDQGIGDFTTLGAFGEAAAARGANIVGVNPLHALFFDQRAQASPYYPCDRRFLDPIYLDLPEAAGAPNGPLIDHPAVWAAKSKALEARFAAQQADPAFDAFVQAGGDTLAQFGAFQAIAEVHGSAWRAWPSALRDATGAGVRAFAAEHADQVRFHQFLQWQCEQQFAAAASRASGLAMGFCRDLAIGTAPDGAEAWSQAHLLAEGVSIGAPPDPLGPHGQIWGLPPYDPHALRADGYRSAARLFATNMRHAGALRIDHVMGLARQFWIPAGADGADGAYVAFPLDDLLGVVALESWRAQCLVIGEDLGTVPPGLRDRLAEANLLSYRVLTFEREDDGRFIPPADYPRLAWACVATHDLPPLAGWWRGLDIDERLSLGLISKREANVVRAERAADRGALLSALADAGLAPVDADPDGEMTTELSAAIHAFIAATPSALAVAQAEDLAGEREAVNLPGTNTERPNWRRRIATPLEQLFETDGAKAILAAMRKERG